MVKKVSSASPKSTRKTPREHEPIKSAVELPIALIEIKVIAEGLQELDIGTLSDPHFYFQARQKFKNIEELAESAARVVFVEGMAALRLSGTDCRILAAGLDLYRERYLSGYVGEPEPNPYDDVRCEQLEKAFSQYIHEKKEIWDQSGKGKSGE